MKKTKPGVSKTGQVDEFMDRLDHPFKAEVQTIRDVIKRVDPEIDEQIKWKAPSFSYKGAYLVTFNLWERTRIHLVFHNPMISQVRSRLLEGDYPDRRMAYFSNQAEIQAKRQDLEKVLRDLIRLQEPAKART